MMSRVGEQIWKKAGWTALFGALAAVVLLQTSPWVVQTPGNDSGIFLYFGAQILRGRLPFVQLWDHKPPLVFYLDALGLLLGGGSRWGVWAVEVAVLLAASLCAFWFLRRYFQTWAALLAVLGMLFNLAFVMEGGNLTEEYALAFQFGALLLFAGSEGGLKPGLKPGQKPGWRSYAIGLLMGGAFLLKQTLIGVWIAMVVYLLGAALFTRAIRGLALLAQIAVGFVVALLVSAGYFALRGGLSAYWDVAFWYNFVYSSIPAGERLPALAEVLAFLNARAGFFILAVMAWVAAIGYIALNHEPALWMATRRRAGWAWLAGALLFLGNGFFKAPLRPYAFAALSLYRWSLIAVGLLLLAVALAYFNGWTERRVYPWMKKRQAACEGPALLPVYLALIDLPVDIALVSLSGRGYLHYFLALFPSLTILVAFLVWSVGSGGIKRAERAMPGVWSAALLLPVLMGGLSYTIEKIHPGADLQTVQTVAYIQEHTQPRDKILMWGTQTGIYFLSGRDAPTRYVHQIPLFNPRYGTAERIQEFLSDLQTQKPALIIDTLLPSMPLRYVSGSPAACAETQTGEPAGMAQVYAFICANYEPAGTLGKDSWVIYRYNPAVQSAGEPH